MPDLEKAAAGGVATLGPVSGLVPDNQLASNSPAAGKALMGDRTWGDVATQVELNAEATTRAADDATEVAARVAAVSAEATARANADTAEATARASADTTLQNNINTEATGRSNADTAEATARAAGDATEAAARAAADTSLAATVANLANLAKTFLREQFGAVAIAGTIDLDTGCTNGGSYTGWLSVTHVDQANAGIRTQTVYTVIGRSSTATFTVVSTANGGTGAAGFTLSMASDGVIRLTNTSGAATNAVLTSSLHQGG